MALIRLVSPFSEFSGKTGQVNNSGGQVLYSVGNRPIARTFLLPSNPSTVDQALVRSYLSAGATGFKSCTAEQKAAWAALGLTMLENDSLGRMYQLSAIQAFQRVNLYRQMAGQAVTQTCPSDTVPSAPTGLSIKASGSSYVIAGTLTTGAKVYIRCTGANNLTRLARENELRSCAAAISDSFDAVAATAFSLEPASPSFTLAENDYCGLEVVGLSTNYVPGPKTFLPQILVGAV